MMDTDQMLFGFPIIEPSEFRDVPDPAVEEDTLWMVIAWNRIGRYWKVYPGCWATAEVAAEEARQLSAQWSHRKLVRIEAHP